MAITPTDVQAKKTELTAPGGVFELEDLVLDGRRYSAYKHAPKTLIEVLQAGRNHGDVDFIVYEGERWSYLRFYTAVDALAAYLQSRGGVAVGDRVAIAMRNNPEWAIAFVAATLIGAIVVPINSWGKSEELRYAISDCGAKVLVCDAARYRLIETQLDTLGVDVLVAGAPADFGPAPRVRRFESAVADGEGAVHRVAQATPTDHCLILYTSGSTGFPKGVVHRHVAVCQSLMNMYFLGMLVGSLEGPRELRGGAERETPLLTVPLFHATGLLSGLIMPLQLGHKVVMMYKWDSSRALQLIQDERVTGLSSVPVVLQDLLSHPRFEEFDTSSLMRLSAAGAATPAGLPELIQRRVANPSRSAGWGMTETMAVGSTMSGAVFDLKPESAGVVSPIVRLRFVDASGREVPQGQSGEMEYYGVCCMTGYWQKPEANAATFDVEGWMKTGDVGCVDADGFLYITGRIKEIVIRGGENIYPGEVEQAAYELPAVRETVVFGVPDATMGEELAMVAFVPEHEALSEEQLREYLAGRLAGYKVPKYVRITDQPLPKNASEKLHKLKVKEAFIAGLA